MNYALRNQLVSPRNRLLAHLNDANHLVNVSGRVASGLEGLWPRQMWEKAEGWRKRIGCRRLEGFALNTTRTSYKRKWHASLNLQRLHQTTLRDVVIAILYTCLPRTGLKRVWENHSFCFLFSRKTFRQEQRRWATDLAHQTFQASSTTARSSVTSRHAQHTCAVRTWPLRKT